MDDYFRKTKTPIKRHYHAITYNKHFRIEKSSISSGSFEVKIDLKENVAHILILVLIVYNLGVAKRVSYGYFSQTKRCFIFCSVFPKKVVTVVTLSNCDITDVAFAILFSFYIRFISFVNSRAKIAKYWRLQTKIWFVDYIDWIEMLAFFSLKIFFLTTHTH